MRKLVFTFEGDWAPRIEELRKSVRLLAFEARFDPDRVTAMPVHKLDRWAAEFLSWLKFKNRKG